MLNLYKLEVFDAVVKAGSFSGAADRLYLTQSAISQHIQDLEGSLGTRLFDRGRRGVTLTPAGETLHEYTQRILFLVAESQAAVTDVHNLSKGQVRVGATPGVSVYLLPGWIQIFQKTYPNLSVSAETDTTAHIADRVQSQRLELGFVEGELNSTQNLPGIQPLDPIELAVMVGRDHPWWNNKTVPTGSLDGQPFIMRQAGSQTRVWVEQLLNKRGCKPRVIAEFDNPESIKHAVSSGMGITIMPRYTVQRELDMGIIRALTIADMDLSRTLKLLWNREYPLSPLARAFINELKPTFPGLKSLAL